MATIGFIGVGNMGGPMAINLVKAGHRVIAYDLSEALLGVVAGAGAEKATDARQVVVGADIVVSMLPSGKIMEDLYIHDTALLDVIDKSTLVIDCSTVAQKTRVTLPPQPQRKVLSSLTHPCLVVLVVQLLVR